jgi:V-type H+-transporting ATPase subunit C
MEFYLTPRHCEHLFLVQVFSSWMHICAIRIFTESILRYGLPPQFLAAVLATSAKNEKKVRTTLESLCDGRTSGFWKSDEDSGMMGLAGGDADVHPYVSITVNLSA